MALMCRKKDPIWINIDDPTKKFTLHHQCRFTENIKETPYKSVNTLKRDGGWLQVDSLRVAEKLYENSYSNYSFANHC
ncbi:hypothetical protein F4694_005839 [Bacillus niacini]|uniref:Uncharacterized protein n=1 Tax=Neobacillus niacini TaxID=86668 RepID=A0A852TJQ6_9BACI|nr:hypothetical protein [Neobacillus niacini]NYE08982.1 hypothetical protein [Neobacillus niacini]